MAEQAAESAMGSAFFVTKFEIRFWKTSSIKCGEHVSTGFRLCDDKDSIDTKFSNQSKSFHLNYCQNFSGFALRNKFSNVFHTFNGYF